MRWDGHIEQVPVQRIALNLDVTQTILDAAGLDKETSGKSLLGARVRRGTVLRPWRQHRVCDPRTADGGPGDGCSSSGVMTASSGMMMARSELEVGFADFIDRLQYALVMSDYLVGIGKAPIFAGIISVIGCFQGFQVAGDAESVGHRTTMSVVQSIFLVIVADALFSVVFNWLGI